MKKLSNDPITPLSRSSLKAAFAVIVICGTVAQLAARTPDNSGNERFRTHDLYGKGSNNTFVVWTADTNAIGAGYERGQRFSPAQAEYPPTDDNMFNQVGMLVATSGKFDGNNACGAPSGLYNPGVLETAPETFTYRMKVWEWNTDYATTVAQTPLADTGDTVFTSVPDVFGNRNALYQWVTVNLATPLSVNGDYFVRFEAVSQTPATGSDGVYWGVWRNAPADGNSGGSNNDAYDGSTRQTDREYIVRLNLTNTTGTVQALYDCNLWISWKADISNNTFPEQPGNDTHRVDPRTQVFAPTNTNLPHPVAGGTYFNQTIVTLSASGCYLSSPNYAAITKISGEVQGLAFNYMKFSVSIWQYRGSLTNTIAEYNGGAGPFTPRQPIAIVTNEWWSKWQLEDGFSTGPAVIKQVALNHPPLPSDGTYAVMFTPLDCEPMGYTATYGGPSTAQNAYGVWYQAGFNPEGKVNNAFLEYSGAINGLPRADGTAATKPDRQYLDPRLNIMSIPPEPQIAGISMANGGVTISFSGGVLEYTTDLVAPMWTSTGEYSGTWTEAVTGTQKYYRVHTY